MNQVIEDVSSKEVQDEVGQLESLENRIWWARGLTFFGGPLCSFWLVYRVFAAHGLLLAFLAFVSLSVVYRFGIPAMFVVAASVLCFAYSAVGAWLPILSYSLGLLLLYVDVKRDNLRRRVDPHHFIR